MFSMLRVGLSKIKNNSIRKIRQAIESQNLESIENLLTSHPEIIYSEIDSIGNSPLLYAIKKGKPESIEHLIKLGCDVNFRNMETAISPLSFLISMRFDEEVEYRLAKLLLEYGAEVDQIHIRYGVSADGLSFGEECTALMCAILNQSMSTIQLLVENGADVNFKCRQTKHSPILWASATGNEEILEYLCTRGDCRREISYGNNTPLHWLCSDTSDNEKCALLLLKFGCDINALNRFAQTPLIIAVKSNSCKIVDVLCENGADKKVEDVYQKTALYYAMKTNCEHCYDAVKDNEEIDESIISDREVLIK